MVNFPMHLKVQYSQAHLNLSSNLKLIKNYFRSKVHEVNFYKFPKGAKVAVVISLLLRFKKSKK